MLYELNLPLILIAAFIGAASPGPATLALAGTSMTHGRKAGLTLASGITTGSFIWSISAAFGLGAVMLTNIWMFELIRYLGAIYLIYLAIKSAQSALSPDATLLDANISVKPTRTYQKGLALHLTNPKAILFFGSLYAIGVPPDASASVLWLVILAVGIQSTLIFHGYAIIFSSKPIVGFYVRMRRWFEGVFAVAFGIMGLKILTAKI